MTGFKELNVFYKVSGISWWTILLQSRLLLCQSHSRYRTEKYIERRLGLKVGTDRLKIMLNISKFCMYKYPYLFLGPAGKIIHMTNPAHGLQTCAEDSVTVSLPYIKFCQLCNDLFNIDIHPGCLKIAVNRVCNG